MTKLNEYVFTDGGTWNFMEADHGRGAPDRIGAVLKRSTDSLVNTDGHSITSSGDLIKGILVCKTKILRTNSTSKNVK